MRRRRVTDSRTRAACRGTIDISSSRRRAAALGVLLLPLTAGCGGDDERTLTVLAAASLTESFTEIAETFEEEHPGVEVRLAFDSSATLAQQAVEGAPADVLATADAVSMAGAVDALDAEPVPFATNHLVLVTSPDAGAVDEVTDLDREGVAWVACVETAPCGRVATEAVSGAGLTSQPASLEVDVKAVLAKVTSGEADAGFVYATDAVAAGEAVRVVELPAGLEPVVAQIAPLQQAGHADLADAFIDLVLSEPGRSVLGSAGFGLDLDEVGRG